MAADSWDVKVYIYDISRGMAKALSQALIGKRLEGIWHTGIVVYGQEFYFGGTGGIECCPPCGTILGQPTTIHDLGKTQIPEDMFLEYLQDLSQTSFRPERYHLLDHNCNTFSSEVAQFLTGNDIPSYVTGLPADVLSTPFGQMIRPFIDSMSVNPSGGHAVFPTHQPSEQSKPSAPTTQQTSSKSLAKGGTTDSQSKPSAPTTQQTSSKSPAKGGTTDSQSNPLTQDLDGALIKPFVFTDRVPEQTYWTSPEVGLSTTEQNHMKEVYEYLEHEDCTWSLGRDHMTTLNRLVLDSDTDCEKCALQVLSRLVLKEDIVQMLSHDPKSRFSEVLQKFENFSYDVRAQCLKMLCNCCSIASGHSFLEGKHRQRVTNICVSSLLEDNEDISSAAIAMSCNLSLRKLSEDTEIELGSALLNCLEKQRDEQTTFHLVCAIFKLVKACEEVRGLASVLGVNFDQHRSKSDRIAKLCEQISAIM